jgi:hypothetical protein
MNQAWFVSRVVFPERKGHGYIWPHRVPRLEKGCTFLIFKGSGVMRSHNKYNVWSTGSRLSQS